MSLDLPDRRVLQQYHQLQTADSPIDWCSFGLQRTTNQLYSYASGAAGIDQLRETISSQEVQYGLLKVEGRILLWTMIPESAGGVKRARALVHSRALVNVFKSHHAPFLANSPSEFQLDHIRWVLRLPPLARAHSHSVSKSNSCTFSSPSASTIDQSTLSNGSTVQPPQPVTNYRDVAQGKGKAKALEQNPPQFDLYHEYEPVSARTSSLNENEEEEEETPPELPEKPPSPYLPSHTRQAELEPSSVRNRSSLSPPSSSNLDHSSFPSSPNHTRIPSSTSHISTSSSFASSPPREPPRPRPPQTTTTNRQLNLSETHRGLPPLGPPLTSSSSPSKDLREPREERRRSETSSPAAAVANLMLLSPPTFNNPNNDPNNNNSNDDDDDDDDDDEGDSRDTRFDTIYHSAENEDTGIQQQQPEGGSRNVGNSGDERDENDGILDSYAVDRESPVVEEEDDDEEGQEEEEGEVKEEQETRRRERQELDDDESEFVERERSRLEEESRIAQEQHIAAATEEHRLREEEEERLERETRERETADKIRREEEEEQVRLARRRREEEEEEAERTRRAKEEMRLMVEREKLEQRLREEEEARRVELEKQKAREESTRKLIETRDRGQIMLSGEVSVQGGGSMLWRRRYYELRGTAIGFFKSQAESSKPLDTVLTVSIQSIVRHPDEPLPPHSFKLLLRGNDEEEWLFYGDTEEEKEMLIEGLSIAARIQ